MPIVSAPPPQRHINNHNITQALQHVRWRMAAQSFLERLTTSLLVAGTIFVIALGVNAVRSGTMPILALLGAACALALLAALTWSAARWLSLAQVAERIDALALTRDRFTTAFSFSQVARPNALQSCALDECERFIRGFDPRPLLRWSIPRKAPWLLAPVIASALLIWGAHWMRERHKPDPATQHQLAEKAAELEKLARQMDAASETAKSEELKKLAEEMRKSAAHLREGPAPGEDADKAALRELSALETQLAQMRKRGATPGELAALAEALQKAATTRDASEALRRGDLGSAADQLEKLSRESNTADQEKLAQAAQEAWQKFDSDRQQNPLAKAMADMARTGSASRSDAQRALQRLAEALRQMANSSRDGGRASSLALQQALSALQELKYGMPMRMLAAKPSGAQHPPEGASVLIQSFQDGRLPTALINEENLSGASGAERDVGTTKTPFGAQQKHAADTATPIALAGLLGEGESLQSLVSSRGDASQATQRYRALYDAMSPAAEDALKQENIPLGSRFFVKRYFEAIRPRD